MNGKQLTGCTRFSVPQISYILSTETSLGYTSRRDNYPY